MITSATEQGMYVKIARRRTMFIAIMTITLILSMLIAITLGVANISYKDALGVVFDQLFKEGDAYSSFTVGVVMRLRLPRILLAVLAGVALGATGALMQSILRNPLASPYTLGVSSGSAFGAALAIVLGQAIFGPRLAQSPWTIVIGAFIFGLLTIFLINIIASIGGSNNASMLILAGVALGYLFSAGVSFIKYITNHEQLRELTVWLMGGLYRATWSTVAILTPIVILGMFYLLRLAWDINALAAGEEVAVNLGVNVDELRRKGSVAAALLTSSVVAFTGIIGFIGLVAPHVTRMIIGNDNRYLIVGSGLVGALLLLVADTLARLIISPSELPVGIITSLLGAPFFLYLLIRKRREYWA